MKKILIAFAILCVVIACKNEDNIINIDTEPDEISLLRADFEKQTGYNYSKEYLLTPAFRTKVNWETAVQKGKDTILINAAVLDSVLFPINGSQIDLKNNVILKAVRNKKSEWSYTTVTFIPTSLTNGYSGMILSRSLSNNVEKIRYYNNGSIIDNSINIAKKFANSGIKAQSSSNSKLRAGCKYAYVNGVLNSITCTPPEKGGLLDDEDPGLGQPGDYFPPGHGGGGGTQGSNGTAQKFNKNDPCGNKKELSNRKKNSKVLAKNNEIKNLTLNDGPGKGFEHGYNAYINLNNGNITRFTDVEVGYSTGGGSQEVPSYEAWNWLPNNQVEVTADYSHTHPFQSGPSAMDVFSGIFPYMENSTGSMTALSPAQKQVYLSYHSINVMTTNHDYAITITDPAKWVSRYPNMMADQDKFRDLFRKYEKSGYDGHTAQELALLDLYGDMIQLYRSDLGMDNFEPVIHKIDSKTLKKIISNIIC